MYDRSVGSVAVEVSPGHASLDHDDHCHIHNTQDAEREREKGLEQLSHTPQHSSHLSPGSACELKWSKVTQQSDREDGEECHSYEYSTVDQGGAGGSRTNPLQSKLDNLVKLGKMGGMI